MLQKLKTMENTLVSICIPTYNGEKFLQEALDSVKNQTYKNIEVIISDDASKDATLAICEQFTEKVPFPVHIYSHQPEGIGANWDHCIQRANGEFIKFLFQDDILEPNCVEEFVKLQHQTGENVFYCKRKLIDEDGADISETTYIADLQTPINLTFDDFYLFTKKDLKKLASKYPTALSHNFFGEPVACFASKKAYVKTGKHNSDLKQLVDFEYSLRLLEHYPVVITAHILTALQQLVSRIADPRMPSVLSFGKIIANGATNVIPNEVYLEGTFRTFDEKWRKEAHKRMKKMATGIAEAMGATCDFDIRIGYPFLVNEEKLTGQVRGYAEEFLGKENVLDLDLWLAGEDFAYYSQETDACFYRLGTGNEAKGITSAVHTPTFDVDESALALSTGLMAYIALRQLGN